jgi:hypothetical protein
MEQDHAIVSSPRPVSYEPLYFMVSVTKASVAALQLFTHSNASLALSPADMDFNLDAPFLALATMASKFWLDGTDEGIMFVSFTAATRR